MWGHHISDFDPFWNFLKSVHVFLLFEFSGVLDSHASCSFPPKSAQTTWSQAATDVSTVDDSLVKPGGCFPPLKACMKERDFNIRLAIEKKQVS